MGIAIPKKYTMLRTKLEFSSIIWMKVGPTRTTESSKECVIRFLTKESFIGCVIVDDFGGEAVNKKNSGKERFILKF